MSPEKKKSIADHLLGNNIVPIIVAIITAAGGYVAMRYQVDADNRSKGLVTMEQVREVSEHEAKEEVAVLAAKVDGLQKMMEEYGKTQDKINDRLTRVVRSRGNTEDAAQLEVLRTEQKVAREKMQGR